MAGPFFVRRASREAGGVWFGVAGRSHIRAAICLPLLSSLGQRVRCFENQVLARLQVSRA
jgi:hypothetical protein